MYLMVARCGFMIYSCVESGAYRLSPIASCSFDKRTHGLMKQDDRYQIGARSTIQLFILWTTHDTEGTHDTGDPCELYE